jgi:hypothetical protein
VTVSGTMSVNIAERTPPIKALGEQVLSRLP